MSGYLPTLVTIKVTKFCVSVTVKDTPELMYLPVNVLTSFMPEKTLTPLQMPQLDKKTCLDFDISLLNNEQNVKIPC